jgi:protein gp37
MSDNSSIEWTEATWNPVTGCTKVSPGCDHCYAETMHERFHGKGSFSTIDYRIDKLNIPLSWQKPRRIFVNSMADLFHAAVPDEFIAEVFAVMAIAERHTFQILTKRHARMRSLLSSRQFGDAVRDAVQIRGKSRWIEWPLRNVWLGVSVENQQWADIRIPALLDTPAAIRWISAEPLLGPVDLTNIDGIDVLDPSDTGHETGLFWEPGPALDWVVVGGESGAGARRMDGDWARTMRDQCARRDVPFLFKQWGAHDANGKRTSKKAAGRILDGQVHDGYPLPVVVW